MEDFKHKVKTVMLVDDSDTDNFINRRVLELSGFTQNIIVKDSGRNALNYISENLSDLSVLPELIFLDINMPIVDGFVFLYEFEDFPLPIREHCKVIILSSSNNKKDIDRMIDNEYVIDFITKPLSLDVLNKITQQPLVKDFAYKKHH